jgi:hypothetical protein
MHKGVVAIGIEHEKPLIEQHVDSLSPCAVDHKLGACLAEHRRRIVDELAGISLNPQIDAALWVGH